MADLSLLMCSTTAAGSANDRGGLDLWGKMPAVAVRDKAAQGTKGLPPLDTKQTLDQNKMSIVGFS